MSLSLRNNSRLAAAGLNKNNQIDPNLGVLREGFQSQELFDENNARAKQEDHHMGVRDEFPNDKEDAGAKQEDPLLGRLASTTIKAPLDSPRDGRAR